MNYNIQVSRTILILAITFQFALLSEGQTHMNYGQLTHQDSSIISYGGVAARDQTISYPYLGQFPIVRLLRDSGDIPTQVKFTNCHFVKTDLSNNYIQARPLNNMIDLSDCKIEYLKLARCNGSIGIMNSSVQFLRITSSDSGRFIFYDNPNFQEAYIDNCKEISLNFQNTGFKDGSKIEIVNSSLSFLGFWLLPETGVSMFFNRDTLNNSFQLSGAASWQENSFSHLNNKIDTAKTSAPFLPRPPYNYFRFSNCYINGWFSCENDMANCIIVFDKCTFGPKARFEKYSGLQISFLDCSSLESIIPLSFQINGRYVFTTFHNTDLENFKMDFSKNVRLLIDKELSNDEIHSDFEKLLSKFRNEGKPESYKYVDIQYQVYKNGPVEDFFKRYWWYYGYRKNYVWWWTFAALILSFTFNAVFWKSMQKTYPVLTNYSSKTNTKNKLLNILRQGFVIFLFTVYTFFSLRISFEKLKFEKVRYVLAFFIQYVIGLWCLFFIFRAVLKF